MKKILIFLGIFILISSLAIGHKDKTCDNKAPYSWTDVPDCDAAVQARCPNGAADPCEASAGSSGNTCSLLSCINKCDNQPGECETSCPEGTEHIAAGDQGCTDEQICCIPSFAPPDIELIPEFSKTGLAIALVIITGVAGIIIYKKKKKS